MRRFVAVVLCVLLGSTLASAAPVAPTPFTPDPASVQRFGPGFRYPQAGWIVLHIEGEPYERGYQHGKLLAPEIADYIQALATYRCPKAPDHGWQDLRLMCNALFLRRYDREYLEEMKGIADGATAAGAKFEGKPLDLVDIATINSGIEVDFLDSAVEATPTGLEHLKFKAPNYDKPTAPNPPLQKSGKKAPAHCSAFAATGPATADGKIVFGHITMWNLYHVRHFNVWLDIKPTKGHQVSMQTFPGGIMSGMDYYQNDAGLLVAETTINQTHFNVDGWSLCSRIRKVLQYSDNIDDAVKILGASNNGLYSNEWLLGDTKTNEIAMYELGTKKTRLWRSSKNEWLAGTEGFYWGCNNTKDLDVRLETIPSVAERPANMCFCCSDRDKAWIKLYDRWKGRIDAGFGFEAFTTPPLAAFPSCDAKFTTSSLAKKMQSYAVFGPPLGRTWEATPEERDKYSDIRPLVANEWTLLSPNPPEQVKDAQVAQVAVDLQPPWERSSSEDPDYRGKRSPVWHGTLLPKTDADIWLAAAFAEYERVVALEKELLGKHKDGKLTQSDRDKLEVALFAFRSKYLTAAIRSGHDAPLAETKRDFRRDEWYDVALGKGVQFLHNLRDFIGAKAFDEAMDDFGRAHAGKEVTTADFCARMEKATDQPLTDFFAASLKSNGGPRELLGNPWSVFSFEEEPEHTLIVYGTKQDRQPQKEAAEHLQRLIARRWYNYTIPIKTDTEVTPAELKSRHLLLIGRPDTNVLVETSAKDLPVTFAAGSFRLADKTYAHPLSAVMVAGASPHSPRHSVVVLAGLSAEGTWQCIQQLASDKDGNQPAEALLFSAGGKPRRLVFAAKNGLPVFGQ